MPPSCSLANQPEIIELSRSIPPQETVGGFIFDAPVHLPGQLQCRNASFSGGNCRFQLMWRLSSKIIFAVLGDVGDMQTVGHDWHMNYLELEGYDIADPTDEADSK